MRNAVVDDKLSKLKDKSFPYSIKVGLDEVTVFENVYPTSELSLLVIDVMDKKPDMIRGKTILDYGTGTGFLAIQAAKRGANVVALDINPAAIECATYNARQRGVSDKIDFRISDCFHSIRNEERFDLILAGMPWDNAKPNDYLEMSMYDHEFRMRKQLFSLGLGYLNEKGRILCTYSAKADIRYPFAQFCEGMYLERVIEKMIKDELHYVYSIRV